MRKTVKFDDKSIAYYDAGNGPVIVLLHGFPLRSDIWQQMIDLLKEDFRVIAPDLIGHGLTSAPEEEMYSMDELAGGVHDLLTNIQVDSCHMVGHSMGGYTALAFAEKYPEMLESLTLFHSTALPDTAEGVSKRKDTIEAVKKDGTLTFAGGMTPKLFSKSFYENNPEITGKVTKWMADTPEHSIIQSLKGMANRPDRTYVLEQFPKKILFVVGNEDALIPPERTVDLVEKAKDGALARLEGVAHMGMLEDPEASAKALKDFIQK